MQSLLFVMSLNNNRSHDSQKQLQSSWLFAKEKLASLFFRSTSPHLVLKNRWKSGHRTRTYLPWPNYVISQLVCLLGIEHPWLWLDGTKSLSGNPQNDNCRGKTLLDFESSLTVMILSPALLYLETCFVAYSNDTLEPVNSRRNSGILIILSEAY